MVSDTEFFNLREEVRVGFSEVKGQVNLINTQMTSIGDKLDVITEIKKKCEDNTKEIGEVKTTAATAGGLLGFVTASIIGLVQYFIGGHK